MEPVWLRPRTAETHVSVVVFLGDRAYKLKKPVSLGFLDFSTVERRRAVCHREVELNRRLAPDVYLGVLDVVDATGRAVDHLVEMRRMPDDRRLTTLVVQGAPQVERLVDELAVMIGRFHLDADRGPAIDAVSSPEAVAALWRRNMDGLVPLVAAVPAVDGRVVEHVDDLAAEYLAGRSPMLDRRVREGRIVDGHGDLLCDDIFCLADGIRVLDCLEFDDALRYGDVALDVAFLVMDLERLGRPDLGERFLAGYVAVTGDAPPASLVDFYVAYRAMVRVKVDCVRAAHGDEAAVGDAVRLLGLAASRMRRARVRVVAVTGAPGTGKSALASDVAAREGWPVVRSDLVRRELAGLPSEGAHPDAFMEGRHRAAMTDRVYTELLGRAGKRLGEGESVVLDATFGAPRWREELERLAADAHAELVALECALPADLAAARIRARSAGEAHGSDVTVEVAARLAAAHQPWSRAHRIDTSGSRDAAVEAAMAALKGFWSQ